MRPQHEFNVVSRLPPSLEPLVGLAANLHWAWDRRLIDLFDRLDGAVDERSWRTTGQHPVDLVRRTSPACWERLADDDEFVADVAAADRRLRDLTDGSDHWFATRSA